MLLEVWNGLTSKAECAQRECRTSRPHVLDLPHWVESRCKAVA